MNKQTKIIIASICALVVVGILTALVLKDKPSNSEVNENKKPVVEEVVQVEGPITEAVTEEDEVASFGLNKTETPEGILTLENILDTSFQATTNDDGTVVVTGYIENISELEDNNMLNHLTQEIVFDKDIEVEDIVITTEKGFPFPNDQIKPASYGRGENLANKLVVTLMDMEVTNKDTDQIEIYKLSFKPSNPIQKLTVTGSKIKTGVYVLDQEDKIIEVQ